MSQEILIVQEAARWGAYTLRQAYRSTFPWMAILVGIGLGLTGLFVQALALIEQGAVFQSWCMSVWRLWSAVGVIAWIHTSYHLHSSVDRWRWCAAFETPFPVRALGQWGAGLLLHICLLGLYALLGWAWSGGMVLTWLQWAGYRSLEIVLLWSVAQCVYAHIPSSWAGGGVMLLYLVGRLAPGLRQVIETGLNVQPDAGMLLKLSGWGITGFLYSVPPFYALDDSPVAVSAIILVLGYAVVLLLYTLWRSTRWPVQPLPQ